MPIRPATPDDVPQVLPMVAKLAALHEAWNPAKWGYRENVSDMYRGWLTKRALDENSVFLVAQHDAGPPAATDGTALIAFLIGTVEREIPIYRLDKFGFIHDVWVEPDFRHEGIARQMTMLAIEKFRELGVKQIRLDTAAKNDAARALFASCGFRESTREMLIEL